ncbi:Crp/Fnr family transcriptional regulator [Pseudoflavitalea sp. G-6-1-2]|uniref:Crp/Fnr family transcriptional regulator n=1 Tax=Pseudoflavitalea sp. G-6-1-2 TaxID=2728841 RepID=UPI00146F6B4C|nr:Crp/Fnr family transcriptional regulator [Pseudoflavitalea sp. G-6-1-2]NML22912.1 Crp/Fnr family transcriptional regulator [Pseudoflavitalea sp. G-6-1-2]
MDAQEQILKHAGQYISLTSEEKEYFFSLLQSKTYYRKEYLQREGNNCNSFTFIIKGCVKSYLLDEKGEEHILTIASADWWVVDYMSFVFDHPGSLFIEAIENTSTLILTKEKREELFKKIPAFNQYFRIITERAFAVSQQRVTDILSLPATERYDKFLERYKGIADSLTQQQIASFIGVTPAFFSRMLKARRR